MLAAATRGAVVFPRKVKAVLAEALAVRDDWDAGRLAASVAADRADNLDARTYRPLRPVKANRANGRSARRLWDNRSHIFTSLRHDRVDATNRRAEHAPRPAVVNRKVWGGSRKWAGVRARAVLMSVLQTATLRGTDSTDSLSRLLRVATVMRHPHAPCRYTSPSGTTLAPTRYLS